MNDAKFSSLAWSDRLELTELQAKAPECLQLLLWPKSPDSKIRLINDHLHNPLYFEDSEAFFVLSCFRSEAQLLTARVDTATCLVTFSHQDGNLSSEESNGYLRLTPVGTQWKVKAVDENLIKIYDGGMFHL
jgi:hypothetical protein